MVDPGTLSMGGYAPVASPVCARTNEQGKVCIRKPGHAGNHLNGDDEEWSDTPPVKIAPDGLPVPVSKMCNWCDRPPLPGSILCATCKAEYDDVGGWPNNADAPVTPGVEYR